MDDAVKLLNAVSGLIAAVILPVVVLMIFRMFRIEINAFIHRANRFAVKGGGLDISIDAQQAQVHSAIEKAYEKVAASPEETETRAVDASAAASMATSTVTPAVVQKASASTILWVDNHPENNVYERRALEAIGATIVLAKSTDEGLAKARDQAFDVIISDMGRGLDRTAGYTLLEKFRKSGIETPFLIYAGSAKPELRAEARKRGAVDATNRPDELFQLVVSVLNTRD